MRTLYIKTFFYILIFITSWFGTVLWSQMGQGGQLKPQDIDAILNSMTEEDFNNILNELSKLSPQELEELEKIGRQVLLESGIDPDTGKPLEQKQPASENASQGSEKVLTQPEVKTAPRVQNPENVELVLNTIITQINTLRQKAQGNDQIARRLSQWAESLNDLVFYIKVINKKEHRERLAIKDFQELFTTLEQLSRNLAANQPQIVLPEAAPLEDDPYLILQLPTSATPEEITQRYTELKKRYSPKKIKDELKRKNASKKEIDREVKAAHLTFSLIQDAYDQLHDPKTKTIIDEKHAQSKNDQLSTTSHNALSQVLNAISNSIYQQKLLEGLQDFLKQFEPEQLAQKQALEAAQTQRKKEHEELAKAKPALNPNTGKYDIKYPQQQPRSSYDNYPSSYGGYGGYGSGSYPSYSDSSSGQKATPGAKISEGEGKKGGGGGGGKPTEGKKSEPDDKTKKMLEDLNKKEADKKKKDEEKKIKDLEEKIKKFEDKEKTATEEKAKAAGKKPGAATPGAAPSGAPAAGTAVRTPLSPLLDTVATDLSKVKKELSSPAMREIMAITKADPRRKLSEAQLNLLQALLTPLLGHLIEFSNKVQNASPETVTTLAEQWQALAVEYGNLITQLQDRMESEFIKYNRDIVIPDQLINLRQYTIDPLVQEFNTIAVKLQPRTTITPPSSPKPTDIDPEAIF